MNLLIFNALSWEQRKLGEMGQTYTGLSGKAKDDFGHGQARFVTYMNVFSNPISNPEMTEPIEIDPKQNEVEVGDVFFTTSSETPEEVGMSSILLEKRGKTYLNSFCFGFRPSEKIDSYYLAYMLRSESTRAKIILLAQGISRYNISKNKVMEIAVSLPSLDEQKMIGQYFSQLDNLITLHQSKAESWKNKINQLSTISWEQRKFSEIAQRESAAKKSSTDFPSVEYEDVVSEVGILNKDVRLKETQKTGIGFDGSQVLYGKLRPYLHNWLSPDFSGVAVGDWWVLKPVNIDKSFLFRLIQTEKFDDIANQSSGSKMPRADWNLLSNTEFMVPAEIEEERKIGQYFSDLDNLITLHQSKAESWKNKKNQLSTIFWEQRKWCDTVDISTEMVDPTSGEYDDMPHIAPGNIESFTGRILDNVKSVKEEQLISGKYRFRPGDVVYGKINPQLGKYFYASVDGLTSADAYVFNGKNGVTQKFLFSLLQTEDFFKYSVSVSKRSGMPKINRDELNAYGFLAPKEEEQEQIGRFLLEIDKLITLHHRKLNRTQICINRSFLYGSF